MKKRIENWINKNRETIVLTTVLPIGSIYTAVQKNRKRRNAPNPALHDKRVARVIADVKHYAKARANGEEIGQRYIRTDRKGATSVNTRISDKGEMNCIRMGDLSAILGLDEERKTLRVEPFATTGDVAKYLDELGLQMENTIEMKGATIGGLVLAIGMTTHSHISGLVHDIVEAYEMVTATGELIRVERDGAHSDLFRAIPWSHGTLGMLVALELRVVPAPKYIRLVYRPFTDGDTYIKEHTRLLQAENTPYFLEGQIFGRNKAVLIEGHLTTDKEVDAAKDRISINDVSKWNKPFFFKHVESTLEHGEVYEEFVPMYSYLLRHERSMCMTMGSIAPKANAPWFRSLFGWMLPPNMEMLKKSRPPEERASAMRNQIYQDFAFPAEHFKELLEFADKEFEIYPLLVYPCKVVDKGGMVRVPGYHGKDWDGKTRSKMFLNFGIYGVPKAIREGNTKYPTVTKVREMEAMIRKRGGFLHTYVDVFSTEKEFETMFDHTLWRTMREKYKANGVFPTIYEKIKPELDPLSFLDEENNWITTNRQDANCPSS